MLHIKKYLVVVVMCIVVILTGCASVNKLTPALLPQQKYLLIETTIDSNLENARSKAISLLSQHIFVTVKSNFLSVDKLKNNTFNSETINNISLDSIGFFKDLTFSTVEKIKKNKYKISVGLTKEALRNTITYLLNTLNFNLIDNLNQNDLLKEYNKTTFLLALIFYAEDHNIAISHINKSKINNYKDGLSLRLSDASQINFNVLPNLTHLAKINIINKDYNASEKIFLPNGIYYYTVYAPGYKPLTQKLEITTKEKLTLNVYLQTLLNKPIKIGLDFTCNSPHLLRSISTTQIASLLGKYQLQVNNFTNNRINIHFSSINGKEFNNYYYFNLPVTISLIKNNNVKLTKIFNIPYVSANKEGEISPDLLLTKLDCFLAEITAGDILNQYFIK